MAVPAALRTVAVTGSTNADLLAAARTGAAEGIWLLAERQEAGRGRQGRLWSSPPGNLYASTVVRLRPHDPPAPSLTLVAAVALAEAVTAVAAGALTAGGDLVVRWPNDLLVGGAKLSGILLERADDTVVAGFGVNCAHHPELPDRRTTSLAAHGVFVTPGGLASVLAERFAAWLDRWRGEGLAAVHARWLAFAHPPGTAVTARLPDGSVVAGAFEGLTPDGALRLGLADGASRVIHAADLTTS